MCRVWCVCDGLWEYGSMGAERGGLPKWVTHSNVKPRRLPIESERLATPVPESVLLTQ